MKSRIIGLWIALPLALASCKKSSPDAGAAAGGAAPLTIGYTLHGLNDFTQIIQRGAQDAGKALGVKVDVQGPAIFAAGDAIAIFEGMVQKRVDGLAVIPMPGDVWVTPIKNATQAGVPVVTANVSSPDSTASTWFGQDEFGSGIILATAIRNALGEAGKTHGTIIVGICAPGVDVLNKRYDGFKKGMAASGFVVSEPFDVGTENGANYGAWENLVGAHADAVAVIGLCSMDLPNLAKLKARSNGRWVVGGYDLSPETLDAIKAGTIQVTLGQHPYLQGYLPVMALVQHLRDKKPLPRGWVDVGTEVVTKKNVEALYDRETNPTAETAWYAAYIKEHFSDLGALAKPLLGREP